MSTTMKILYVSQYFPPEMGAPAARVHELSRAWARQGHQVTVLTAFPNHPTGIVTESYRRALRRGTMRETVDGIDVVRTWLYAAPNRAPRERILNYTSFLLSAVLRGIWLDRPDVVIGSSPQLFVGLAAWVLARRFRCPFVFEVRDLWPESLPASGISHVDSRLYRALDRLARFLYRAADLVVPVTKPFCATIAAAAPDARQVVVENGVDTELFKPRADREEIRRRLGLDGRFVASYIGTLGFAHGLETALEAAALLRARKDFLLLLVGEGADRARLEARARAEGLDNVRFEGQHARARMPEYVAASDVCLVLLRDSPLFRTVLPSKMLEFMACGRPVVAGLAGYAAELLDMSGGGLCVPPGDPVALAEAIDRIREEPLFGEKLGHAGQSFVRERFTRRVKAQTYLDALGSLLRDTAVSRRRSAWAKRALDIALAGVGLVVSLPVWAAAALAIKAEDRGAVFFRDHRVGQHGRVFDILKFRTMVPDADRRFGPRQATEHDPRITKVGRLLRATAMDELPQLWNIFRGDMSFVGPRALRPGEIHARGNGRVVALESIPGYRERQAVRPGLTGVAQIYADRDVAPQQKFRYDRLYIRRQTFMLDVRLILISFLVTFRGRWERRGSKV